MDAAEADDEHGREAVAADRDDQLLPGRSHSLHEHALAGEGVFDGALVVEIELHTAVRGLVAEAEALDRDGPVELPPGAHRVVGDTAVRHRNARAAQDRLRLVLLEPARAGRAPLLRHRADAAGGPRRGRPPPPPPGPPPPAGRPR